MLHASPTLNTVNMSSMTDTHVHMARVCLANILHNCNQQRLCVEMAQPNPKHLCMLMSEKREQNTFPI